MKRKRKNPSKHQRQAIGSASDMLPILERGDLAWMLFRYKKAQQETPQQTLSDFLMNYGERGWLFRFWFSVDALFRNPENYVCVWHGTTQTRSLKILEKGFIPPVYTSFNTGICLGYAEGRARVESDWPALIACVLKRLDVQRCIAHLQRKAYNGNLGHLIFKVFPHRCAQFVLVPPETWNSDEQLILDATWRIDAQTPGLLVPSQDELGAMLGEWGVVQEWL